MTYAKDRADLMRMIQRFLDLVELGMEPILPDTTACKDQARELMKRLKLQDWEQLHTDFPVGRELRDPTNADRAARGQAAIAAYLAIEGMDEENALPDLLADLMHWAEANGKDWERDLRVAAVNHEAEVSDES